MKKLTIAIAAVLVATSVSAQTQPSGPICGLRSEIVAQLTKKYGEHQREVRVSSPTSVVERWEATYGGTWTVLVSFADGTACMVAAGKLEGKPA